MWTSQYKWQNESAKRVVKSDWHSEMPTIALFIYILRQWLSERNECPFK